MVEERRRRRGYIENLRLWLWLLALISIAALVMGILAYTKSDNDPYVKFVRVTDKPSQCWAKPDSQGKRHCSTGKYRRIYITAVVKNSG